MIKTQVLRLYYLTDENPKSSDGFVSTFVRYLQSGKTLSENEI